MVTGREYRIAKVVAVWRNDEGVLHVLPPCGRCREFMRQIDPANLKATIFAASLRRRGLSSNTELNHTGRTALG
jgi:cytidine deaminase